MKYKIIALVALITITVGACSSQSPSSSTPTNELQGSRQTTTTVPKPVASVDEYVASMRTIFPYDSRATLIDLGKQACALIDAAGSVSAATLAILGDPAFIGLEYEAGYTMGAAIETFCPEYIKELRQLANGL